MYKLPGMDPCDAAQTVYLFMNCKCHKEAKVCKLQLHSLISLEPLRVHVQEATVLYHEYVNSKVWRRTVGEILRSMTWPVMFVSGRNPEIWSAAIVRCEAATGVRPGELACAPPAPHQITTVIRLQFINKHPVSEKVQFYLPFVESSSVTVIPLPSVKSKGTSSETVLFIDNLLSQFSEV